MKHFLFSGAHPDGKPWQLYIVCFISNIGQHKNSNTRRYSLNSGTHLPQQIRLPHISQFFCCCAFPRCLTVCSLHSSTRVQQLNGTTLNTALLGKKILLQNLHLISIFEHELKKKFKNSPCWWNCFGNGCLCIHRPTRIEEVPFRWDAHILLIQELDFQSQSNHNFLKFFSFWTF